MPKIIIKGVMSWENPVSYFIVIATLTSLLNLCTGQVIEVGKVLQMPNKAKLDDSHSSDMRGIQNKVQLRRVGIDIKDEPAVSSRNGSLSFDNQADQPVSARRSLMDAKLKRMEPSVQCSYNSMTLKVKRSRAPRFLVDSGEGSSSPFSRMPSHCGFSVRRSRRDVLFAAPYQGCHVTQQGGNYVLPLRLWGAPMTMSCPVAVTPPSVTCFPSGMVLKIGGATTNELKVKVSGLWQPLSSVCSGCGFVVEVVSGGLMLSAPYNKGLCIELKDDEYLLSLLLDDGEFLVTCPTPASTITTETTTPSDDSGQLLQYPLYPQFPIFPQYPAFPEPVTHTTAPTIDTPQIPQHPMFQRPLHPFSMTTDDESEVPPAQLLQIPHLPQYPQYHGVPQYLMFPRPIPPTQSPVTTTSTSKNTAAPSGQFPQMPQFPYQIFPQYPMIPGNIYLTPPPTTTKALMSTTVLKDEDDVLPQPFQKPQFPMLPQYSFLPFPNLPLHPESHPQRPATDVLTPEPETQAPQPHPEYPQIYQIPVLHPPPKYPFQFQVTAPTPPATTPATTAATTVRPPAQKPFYHPYHYIPAYYAPQQSPASLIPDPPTTNIPPTSPASIVHPQHQNNYYPIPSFYPFAHPQKPHLIPAVTKPVSEQQKQTFMPYDVAHQFRSWNVPFAPQYPLHT